MARQSTAKAGESKQSGKEGKMGEQRLLFRGTRPTVEKKEGRKEEREREGKREKKEKKEERVARRINK